ncbi:MAG: leucine-rich repeat domain-containing protein [Prevotellaceae bacterium]|jgi:hypothetical protein|nr:leucine-rich repeat domain-containing protein [Prevotellaceae bacterium]
MYNNCITTFISIVFLLGCFASKSQDSLQNQVGTVSDSSLAELPSNFANLIPKKKIAIAKMDGERISLEQLKSMSVPLGTHTFGLIFTHGYIESRGGGGFSSPPVARSGGFSMSIGIAAPTVKTPITSKHEVSGNFEAGKYYTFEYEVKPVKGLLKKDSVFISIVEVSDADTIAAFEQTRQRVAELLQDYKFGASGSAYSRGQTKINEAIWSGKSKNPADPSELAPGISWRLVGDTLVISGKGEMPDKRPWYSLRASIAAVRIEEGITKIVAFAFTNYKALVSVSIAASVEEIGASAFNTCKNLTSVEIFATKPPKMSGNSFNKLKATLTVPVETKSAYKADKHWSKFTTIVEREQ